VLGYGGGDPYWNDIVFGAIVGVLALLRLALPAQARTGPVSMLIGAWVFAAAFCSTTPPQPRGTIVILGIIVFVLGAIASTTLSARGSGVTRGA
jgi:hypothetical protein